MAQQGAQQQANKTETWGRSYKKVLSPSSARVMAVKLEPKAAREGSAARGNVIH